MKKIIAIFTVLLLVLSGDLFAKGGTGGRAASFGSRSVSRSISPTIKTGSISSTSGGPSKSFFKFGSKTGSNSVAAVSKPSKLFETFKAANTAPPKRVVASDLKTMFSKDYKVSRRQSYYGGYHAPTYVQPQYIQTHSSYGPWDSLVMWSILDDMGDRQMYYHHQNDPGFVQWRNDANDMCQQGNSDVCKKLADLDKEVNSLKAQGIKQNAGYITDGVDPNIYLSDNIKMDDLGEVRICTGTKTSDYTRFASQIADKTKLKVRTVESSGSVDNLVKMAHGDCDLAFTQPDAAKSSPELTTVFELDKVENGLLVCNAKSGIKTVNDLSSKNTIYVGSDQTGSLFTYNTLVSKNTGKLGSAMLNNTLPVIGAASAIEQSDNACFFAVDTSDAPYILQLAKGNKTKFVSLGDGISGYTAGYINDDPYKNMMHSSYTSWFNFWSKGTPTVSMKPQLVTTATWAQNNPVVMYDVLTLNKNTLTKELQ